MSTAYIQQLTEARKNNRYFGRNQIELTTNYGSDIEELQAAAKFLEYHGFKITIPKDKIWDLLDDFEVNNKIVHESELKTSPESKR